MLGRFGFNSQQTLRLRDLSAYCTTMSDFNDFVSNVQLDHSSPSIITIEKIIKTHPIHSITPIKRLCLRYINQLKVINQLHVIFMTQAVQLYLLKQALVIAQAQAIPYKLQPTDIQNYQFACFQLYFKLGMYDKAWIKIQKLITNPKQITKKYEKYLKCYLLMSKISRSANIDSQMILTIVQKSLNSHTSYLYQKQKDSNIQVVHYQNLINYVLNNKYSKQLLDQLIKQDKSKLVQQIYEVSKNINYSLIDYVKDFKRDKLQRVKISDIKNLTLDNPVNMNQINRFQNLARYDCKEKILYINHQKGTNQEINQLITKCFGLHAAIQEIPKIKETMPGRMGFGGMGGLGGMSGMGRMMM